MIDWKGYERVFVRGRGGEGIAFHNQFFFEKV